MGARVAVGEQDGIVSGSQDIAEMTRTRACGKIVFAIANANGRSD